MKNAVKTLAIAFALVMSLISPTIAGELEVGSMRIIPENMAVTITIIAIVMMLITVISLESGFFGFATLLAIMTTIVTAVASYAYFTFFTYALISIAFVVVIVIISDFVIDSRSKTCFRVCAGLFFTLSTLSIVYNLTAV